MNDTFEGTNVPVTEPVPAEETHTLRVAEESVAHPVEGPAELNGAGEEVGAWRTEAGRKGAKRVHQLIQAGKLYEQEHGLTSGRQRLRQLIELGKLYEQEHGVRPVHEEKRQGGRLSKGERDEVVATLLRCLVRIAKPSFRPELERLVAALSPEKAQAA